MFRPSTARHLLLLVTALMLVAACNSSTNSASGTKTSAPGGSQTAAPPEATADIPALVRQVQPSVVTVITDKGLGSGIVYRPNGTIVTGAHVVAGATQVTVAFVDGQQVPAQIHAADQVSDVAVLTTNRNGLTAATFQKNLPQVGEFDVAIGSPLGFEATVTHGIVSGLHRNIPGSASAGVPLVDLIQTDAPISPGNSGGALVNGKGQVIGVSEAYIPPVVGAVALGFATPAATVTNIADQLIATGVAHHAYIGIQPATLTPEMAKLLGVNQTSGVVVQDVVKPGPAADAGLQPGDIIVAVDGKNVATAEDLIADIEQHKPGDRVQLTVLRGNAKQDVTVVVADRPANT
jgi:serine protease DegQ